jgi:hypothetical protein
MDSGNDPRILPALGLRFARGCFGTREAHSRLPRLSMTAFHAVLLRRCEGWSLRRGHRVQRRVDLLALRKPPLRLLRIDEIAVVGDFEDPATAWDQRDASRKVERPGVQKMLRQTGGALVVASGRAELDLHRRGRVVAGHGALLASPPGENRTASCGSMPPWYQQRRVLATLRRHQLGAARRTGPLSAHPDTESYGIRVHRAGASRTGRSCAGPAARGAARRGGDEPRPSPWS